MGQKAEAIQRTNIQYGHNRKDRVVVEFSQQARTLFMTPAEATAMILSIQESMRELEAYQKQHGITPPPEAAPVAPGQLNG